VYLTATTIAQAYPRIEIGELRRSVREEMKETKKEPIREESAT
jgi:hypothetical protein